MSKSAEMHKASAPKRLSFGIFTVSTSRFERINEGKTVDDASGDLMESLLKGAGHSVVFRKTVSDDIDMIKNGVKYALNLSNLDVVVFSGGTGITASDVTIETVQPLLEKLIPGFGEIFRRLSFDQIGSSAVLSRAIAGVSKKKVFFCIPGSPDAARLCFESLILSEAGHIVKHARE